MRRDMRDPQTLGLKLLTEASMVREHFGDDIPLSEVADNRPLAVRDYASNEGPLERYGDPREAGERYLSENKEAWA